MSKTFNFDNVVSSNQTGSNNKIEIFDNIIINDKFPVQDIDINLLDIINNQPFREYNDDDLDELKNSIQENGLLSPIVVNKDGSRYKILSGRNRFRACMLLGWSKVPCKVLDVDEVQANLILVDSNLNQRQNLLPSEKAYSYKIKIESLASLHNKSFSQAVEELSNAESVTKRNIYRYLKLAQLSEKLIQMVDDGSITITAGVTLADFDKQNILAYYLLDNNKKINDKVASALIDLQQKNDITYETLDVFFNKKADKVRKDIKINYAKLSTVIKSSDTMNDEEIENFIINAINFYNSNNIQTE